MKIYFLNPGFFFMFLLTGLLIFPSCQTRKMSFKAQNPAAVSVLKYISKVVLISRNDSLKGALYAFQKEFNLRTGHSVSVINSGITTQKDSILGLDWASIARLTGNDTNTSLIVLGGASLSIWRTLNTATSYSGSYFVKDRSKRLLTDEKDFEMYNRGKESDRILVLTYSWSIYDLKSKKRIDTYEDDEQPFYDEKYQLTAKADSLSGNFYADRLSPQRTWLYREYYKKGNGQMKTAAALAKADNWKEAAIIWKMESMETDKHLAGKALYNLALYEELNNNLDKAIEYITKAKELGEQGADDYLKILRARKRQ